MPGSPDEAQIAIWLADLRGPDVNKRQEAERKLFARYAEQLQRAVKDKLSMKLRNEVDTEAVAQSALRSFLQKPRSFIEDEKSLVRWLMHLTAVKRIEHVRAATAQERDVNRRVSLDNLVVGGGDSDGINAFGDASQIPRYVALPRAEKPTGRRKDHHNPPEPNREVGDEGFDEFEAARLILLEVDAATAALLIDLLEGLPVEYQEIAGHAIQGDTNATIARKLNVKVHIVQRSIRKIFAILSEELRPKHGRDQNHG